MCAAVQVLIAVLGTGHPPSLRTFASKTSTARLLPGWPHEAALEKTASARALYALTVRAGLFNTLGEASGWLTTFFAGASSSQPSPCQRSPLWVNVAEQARQVWRV